MSTSYETRERLAGTCWMLGGALWVVHVVVLDARPEGCIAAGCRAVAASARPTEDVLWLFLVSVAALGLGFICAPWTGTHGRTARRVATGLVVAGVAALSVGLFVNAALVGDSPLWWLHDSDSLGRFLPVLGSVMAGVAAWQGQWLGRWQGTALVLAATLSLGFNAQTDRIWFTVPLGAAWMMVGAAQVRVVHAYTLKRNSTTSPSAIT